MAERALVTKNGAILLGDSVACDAFDKRPIRIVTHAHADHLYGLRKSVKCCEKVIMTKATRDLAITLDDKLNLDNESVHTLEYGKVLKYGDEKITLLKSRPHFRSMPSARRRCRRHTHRMVRRLPC